MAAHEASRRQRLAKLSGARQWLLLRPTAFWIALVEIALIIGFNFKSDGLFLTRESLMNLALDAAVGMLLAVGMTFLLAAAQLDLSVGANLVLSSCVAAWVITKFIPIADSFTAPGPKVVWTSLLACLAAIASGTAFGVVNGVIVTKLRVNSFIATLGTAGAASGLVLVWTNGSNITGFPSSLQTEFGVASIRGLLPYQMLIVLVISVVLWFVMRKTRLGLHAVALGSSPSAVRRSGVSSTSVLIRLFAIVGALAGLAGFFVMARFSTTNIGGSQDAPLAAIAAAVIGGTSLFGGVATVGGSMVGSLLPVILASGLIVIGVESFYQQIVVGLILILAVYIDQERRSRRESL